MTDKTRMKKNKWITIFTFLLIVSVLSGLINNTAAVAIFIPLAINLCQRFHISPTKILLPLSYAAIFGGTLTLIGTSTNLIVNSFLENNAHLEPFRMFEFTKLGLIFVNIFECFIGARVFFKSEGARILKIFIISVNQSAIFSCVDESSIDY